MDLDKVVDPTIMYVRVGVAKAITELEKLRTRYEAMAAGQVPVLPAEDYPRRLSSIDPLNPPEKPAIYLLSIKSIDPGDRPKHDVYVYEYSGPSCYQDNLDLILSQYYVNPPPEITDNPIYMHYFKKSLKEALKNDFARMYVTTPEIADTVHLYDCKRAGNDLLMTPKADLKDAELEGWFYKNRDVFGRPYNITKSCVGRARQEGYKINALAAKTKPAGSSFLDVHAALEELYVVRDQAEAYYQEQIKPLLTAHEQALAAATKGGNER